MVHPDDEDIRMLRIDSVLELVPVSKVSLYRMIKDGSFPPPVKAGGTSLWCNEEVRAWKKRKLENRTAPSARKRDLSDLV